MSCGPLRSEASAPLQALSGVRAAIEGVVVRWLRSFHWHNVRRLDSVSRQTLTRLWQAGARPVVLAAPMTVDLDSTHRWCTWAGKQSHATAAPRCWATTRSWRWTPAPAQVSFARRAILGQSLSTRLRQWDGWWWGGLSHAFRRAVAAESKELEGEFSASVGVAVARGPGNCLHSTRDPNLVSRPIRARDLYGDFKSQDAIAGPELGIERLANDRPAITPSDDWIASARARSGGARCELEAGDGDTDTLSPRNTSDAFRITPRSDSHEEVQIDLGNALKSAGGSGNEVDRVGRTCEDRGRNPCGRPDHCRPLDERPSTDASTYIIVSGHT